MILGVALRAFALDVTVGEKHAFDRIKVLLDRLFVDQARFVEPPVNVLRQIGVLRRFGGVPVVELDVKAVQVLFATGGNVGHECLRRFAGFFGGDHNRRAVGVVGANKVNLMPLHALETHPDIGLDVLHDVPDMEGAIGVRQGGGDEDTALVHGY